MEIFNQVSYLMFAAFTMGLAIKSYFEFNNQLISRELKSNWAWSLLFLVLSNMGYAIGSMGFHVCLLFGNVFLIFALLKMGLFFRVIHGSITSSLMKWMKLTIFVFTLIYSLLFIEHCVYFWRFYLMSIFIVLMSLWHLDEIARALKKEITLHLTAIFYLKVVLLIVLFIRIMTAQDIFDDTVHYVYQESLQGLFARLMLSGINLANFVLVGGYISEKILLGEKNLVTQLNDTIVQLKTVTHENDEVQQLLDERECLISSLVKAKKIAETSALSASIAHELSQPLCAIQLNAQSLQFLMHEPKSQEIKEATLERIIADNQRASDIIISLKQLFTSSGGRLEKVSLDQLVAKIGVIVMPIAKMNSITLHYSLNAPDEVDLCVGELQQVIINLCTNAVHALENVNHNEKEIRIQTEQTSNSLRLMVSDNGTGIPDTIGNTIFDLMKTSKSEGMGVGLWLSRYIVKRHGGALYYENQSHGGVAFIMELPVIRDCANTIS
jgi:C4-dicarboxylate-specific signal transduction histidine kinase